MTVASKDMEPEVTCVNDNMRADGLGELKGGFMFKTWCNLSRK